MRRAWWWAVCLCLAGATMLLMWPVTVRRSVDYAMTTTRIPLYEKAIHFVSRSLAFRRLARELTEGLDDEQQKAQAILAWLGEHVHSGIPEGLPVVDDHVYDVAVRGYGTDDQLADLYAVLSTYAGMRALRIHLFAPHDRRRPLAACAVRINGQWRFVDPYRHVAPRHHTGEWITVDELITDPTPAAEQAAGMMVRGLPYTDYLLGLEPVRNEDVPRAWKQVPLRRAWYELHQLWERFWSAMRPTARRDRVS